MKTATGLRLADLWDPESPGSEALLQALCTQVLTLEGQVREREAQRDAEHRERVAAQLRSQELEAQLQETQARLHEAEVKLGQNSSSSSRPPSADPPETAARAQRQPSPSGRKRGGQPGHPGRYRALLPLEQVDEVVLVAPEVFGRPDPWRCGQGCSTRWPGDGR